MLLGSNLSCGKKRQQPNSYNHCLKWEIGAWAARGAAYAIQCIELAQYLIHVHWHMFPMKLENMTVRCRAFGGVHRDFTRLTLKLLNWIIDPHTFKATYSILFIRSMYANFCCLCRIYKKSKFALRSHLSMSSHVWLDVKWKGSRPIIILHVQAPKVE